ncbi:MAG: response regulator transcription factor [Rhodocyclales bacterium]|nr:response regulator transcription factor [Rhodocyclales bacterium]
MRILVVDPNPLFLQAAANFLAALAGCETVLAGSGEEALRLAPTQQFDMVLLDYALGRADGVDLLRQLKLRAWPPLIVVLSPEDASAYRAACLEAGADACLAKASLGADLPALLMELAQQDGASRATGNRLLATGK